MEQKINSKEYWNERFATGDWQEKGGNRQTRYFYELLCTLLPEHLKKEFNDSANAFTLCDVGCAEGDGTKVLAECLEHVDITGIDVAEAAIARAKANYPDLKFGTKLERQYDIVVSSNVLEHFENPFEHMRQLFAHSNRYVVMLVPFEEHERVPEHFYTFLYKDFKLKFNEFELIYLDYIFSREPLIWEGKQHLFIYKKSTSLHDVNLSQFGIATIVKKLEEKISDHESLIGKQQEELNAVYGQLETMSQKIEKRKEQIKEQEKIINNQTYELHNIHSSNMWKVAQKYYALKESPLMQPIVKLLRNLKKHGPGVTAKKIYLKSSNIVTKMKNDTANKETLQNILKKFPKRTVVILPVLIDWNIPLFQRPQHLAKNMAKNNILYFFCTDNWQYDNVNGFEEIVEGCYITNRFDLVDQISNRKKYYDLSSTDNITDWDFVQQRLMQGHGIIYQYIDEISSELSGFKIPEKTLQKHFNILRDERCIVIPSATKLKNEVKEYRSKNYKLVTNGVELEHFRQIVTYDDYPEEIKAVVKKQKPVIGYFGAFASWFDYDLVLKLATQRPDIEIVLLGWDYDGSIKKYAFENYENITILGPIEYPVLPKYAACFSVSTIPFIINDITESTSPIKLFEYMAMGKPIVTTDMPECRKYESVLIGKDHEDFIKKIDEALTKREDKAYLKLLQKEASQNSWDAKAKDIVDMIDAQ